MPQDHDNFTKVAPLQCPALWRAFANIATIPHCSKHEKAIIEFIAQFASKHGHEQRQDASGNLLVSIKALAGFEAVPGLTIQSHVDMVCEKNQGTCHDFLTDPIKLELDGDWLSANETTLGADNGIGVAMMIALMSEGVTKQAIDLLFTIDEETGLTGALHLDEQMLRFEDLINLDGEEEGFFYIGCAGGSDTKASLALSRLPVTYDRQCYQIEVKGLQGGHSGADIHLKRANAIKLVAVVLEHLLQEQLSFDLYSVDGGDKHNAIPREARAEIGIAAIDCVALSAHFEVIKTQLYAQWQTVEQDIEISFSKQSPRFEVPISPSNKSDLLAVIKQVPHGVVAMSTDIADLVSISNNLASVKTEHKSVVINASHRADNNQILATFQKSVADIFEAKKLYISSNNGYPAWTPQPNNSLVNQCKQAYLEFSKQPAQIAAIHAGLECGVIGSKKPDLRMISFGPTIRGAHTPEEKVSISSTVRIWNFLIYLIDSLTTVKKS